MLLQIFGLAAAPSWWLLNRLPAGGGEALARVLREQLPQGSTLRFFGSRGPLEEYSETDLEHLRDIDGRQIIAKSASSAVRDAPNSGLRLMSTTGPDAGRSFPLTRRGLSVGRSGARAQLHDPWLSSLAFGVRLTSNGTMLEYANGTVTEWPITHTAGVTNFVLHRGSQYSVGTAHDPGPFTIDPGQPPSPPNLVLQVIGAAAPLLIGVILMVVTGMWYFLLFSGISVIIAVVMISQYRRARRQFMRAIDAALERRCQEFSRSVVAPHDLSSAIRPPAISALDSADKSSQPPVINWGTGVRQASIAQLRDATRWDEFLLRPVQLITTLHPGQRTLIIGSPATLRPVKNWLQAQLFHHLHMTHNGLIINGQALGGPPVVEISDDQDAVTPSDRHLITFGNRTSLPADVSTWALDLTEQTFTGEFTATAVRPLGISASTLQAIRLEYQIDKPTDAVSTAHLHLGASVAQAKSTEGMITCLGTGPLGLTIDLVKDGPHMLITGTTGSGKSELLLTVLIGFAQHYPAAEVSMILLDFKGGSSFNVLAPLPHTMSVETNHVADTSFRSLHAISAELQRREQLFAEHHVADYLAFRQTHPEIVLPRLIVAIDELRVLVDQNPEAATTLARLAATGRSLGFHLILATQRTHGAVNADIRANIGCVISLRTATEHDSWDVIGTADAYRISPAMPGRAYFKAGADAPRLFQTARYVHDDEPVTLVPHIHESQGVVSETTNWPMLVQDLLRRTQNLLVPQPAILPALPAQTTIIGLQTDPIAESFPIGLVDHPALCRQYPVFLGPDHAPTGITLTASVAWIGATTSGIHDVLELVLDHTLNSLQYRVLLEGRQFSQTSAAWDVCLQASETSADILQLFLHELTETLVAQRHTTLVITDWGSWSGAMVTGSFHGFEEHLVNLLRQFSSYLTIYVFGARELAGGRLIAMIPDRFYVPKNSTAEHQLIWPTLISVPAIAARAVLVTAEHPVGGLEVQLCTAER